MFVFLLGISYVGVIQMGLGVVAVSLAIVVDFCWRAVFLGAIYYRRNWMEYGTTLMEERGSVNPET